MEKTPKALRLGQHYDRLYAAGNKAFGEGKPVLIVSEAVKFLPEHASVVEYGAGQGRNAIFLAEKGFAVRAVDLSEVGVSSINAFAEEKNLPNLRAEVGDVREGVSGEYDMIVSTFMLHHLSPEEGREFLNKIKLHTKEGGINAISVFTSEGDVARSAKSSYFFPALGEMKELYSGWEILNYSEVLTTANDKRPDGTNMTNIKAEILARKPQI